MHSETTLHIPADHPAFAGHFPGTPIVPGVVLLDAVVHAALQLMQQPTANAGERSAADVCRISAAKFLSPVRPGETVTICLDVTAAGHARFDLRSGDRKVATGTLVVPPAP